MLHRELEGCCKLLRMEESSSALQGALQKPGSVKHHYEVEKRAAKPLSRPHGNTEAKRRREKV